MSTEIARRESTSVSVTEPDSVLAIIAAAAKDPTVDVAKMQALLNMKERLDIRQAEIEFNCAMARLSKDLPRITKDGRIFYAAKEGRAGMNTPYATFENIDTFVRPLLLREGFYISFTSEATDKGVEMICTLGHAMGHAKTSRMRLPPDAGPGRNALQAIGSARSYGKRYLYVDILNIITEGADDDGKASGFITTEQANKLHDLMAACELTAERKTRFLAMMKVDALEHIQQYDFERAAEALRAEFRKKQAAGK